MGYHVGQRVVDVLFIREKTFKREIRLLNVLLFIKGSVWKTLFGKEADKLESATDDETTCELRRDAVLGASLLKLALSFELDYIIEAEPLVNRFISVPKDKGTLNCAAFLGGIIEAVLTETNFVSTLRKRVT